MTVRVRFYLRCSTDKQDTSIDLQRQRLATELGHEADGVYVDDGLSGTLPVNQRPGLRQAIQDAKAHGYDELWVFALSRFGRTDTAEFWSAWGALESAGVRVRSINEPVPEGAFRDTLLTFINASNREYARQVGLTTLTGRAAKARAGEWMGTVVGYGYRIGKVDGKRKPVLGPVSEVEVVRRIYLEREDGKGYRRIAIDLNAEGVSSPAGKKWTAVVVRAILCNPVYKGAATFGRRRGDGKFWSLDATGKPALKPSKRQDRAAPVIVTEGAHEGIIPPNQWERVQAINRAGRMERGNQHGHDAGYLLTGRVRCALCGGKLLGVGGKDRPRYYTCSSLHRHGPSVCSGGRVRADDLEREALSALRKQYRPAVLRKIKDRLKHHLHELTRSAESRGALEAELRLKEAEADRARRAFLRLSEQDQDKALIELERIKGEADVLRRQLEALPPDLDIDKAADGAMLMLMDMVKLLKGPSGPAQKATVQRAINSVTIDFAPREQGEQTTIREAVAEIVPLEAQVLTAYSGQSQRLYAVNPFQPLRITISGNRLSRQRA